MVLEKNCAKFIANICHSKSLFISRYLFLLAQFAIMFNIRFQSHWLSTLLKWQFTAANRCKKRNQMSKCNTHSLNRNKNKTPRNPQQKIVIIQSNVNCLKLDESRVSRAHITSHQKAVRLYSKRYTEWELIFGLECRSSFRLTWIRAWVWRERWISVDRKIWRMGQQQ